MTAIRTPDRPTATVWPVPTPRPVHVCAHTEAEAVELVACRAGIRLHRGDGTPEKVGPVEGAPDLCEWRLWVLPEHGSTWPDHRQAS